MTDEGTSVLPAEARDALKSSYDAYVKSISERSSERAERAKTLAALASLGRDAGWSYKRLAEPCGVTPERLRQIVNGNPGGKPPKGTTSVFPAYAPPRKEKPQVRAQRAHLTEDEARELRDLAGDARRNTGSRPLDSPYRIASVRFSDLIKMHHDRGVIWDEISDATRNWESWPLSGKAAKHIETVRELRREQSKLRAEHKSIPNETRALRLKIRSASKPDSKKKRTEAELDSFRARITELESRREEINARLKEIGDELLSLEKSDPLPPQHTASGIRMRAARHGYGKGAPPSISGYRGVVIHPPQGGNRKQGRNKEPHDPK